MSEPGIVFEHVWKKYRRGEVHDSLRDLIPALVRRKPKGAGALGAREFWALSDVEFEVRPGEALGIIGANGAGKSTALKLLNRIMRPTRGRIEVRGRIGSLIEISAGFHQDLTGRENIFLQGAIMGMRKAEIREKFDGIVEFSGISEFIDTPVKRYSSGMNARLGFSIAAHLDPEVLIIDEVLAVGDLSFQNRAFDRIKDMVATGVPVVLVSHQLERVTTLCTKALLLSRGSVVKTGTPGECIAEYVSGIEPGGAVANDADAVRLDEVRLLDEPPIRSGDLVRYQVRGTVRENADGRYDPLHLRVRSAQTGRVLSTITGTNYGIDGTRPGPFAHEVELQMNVAPGIYVLETGVYDKALEKRVAGPALHVQVSRGAEFRGTVQFNARIRPASDAPAAAEALGRETAHAALG